MKRSEKQTDLVKSLRQGFANVFPPVTAQLMSEAVKPEPDFKKMAAIIKMDPALAVTILSVSNSSYYRRSSQVVDLERAAVVLGNKELMKIAVSVSFQSNMNDALNGCGQDIFHIWRMVVWSAIAAESIAELTDPSRSEVAYICTLIKDISLLLLCATRQLDKFMPEKGKKADIIALGDNQLAQEISSLGMTHAELTQCLLNEWDYPEHCSVGISCHHDIANIDKYEPFVQAIVLATRWAEVEFQSVPRPELVFQFQIFLKEKLGLADVQLEKLRESCCAKFQSTCNNLKIDEDSVGNRYYDHSLQSMQNLFFLSMEVQNVEGGTPAIAAVIARHLGWHWSVEGWNLALFSPQNERWCFFEPEIHQIVKAGPESESRETLPWQVQGSSVRIMVKGRCMGELRYNFQQQNVGAQENLELYFRFLSHHYSFYYLTHARMEAKAQTLDILPVGVARLDMSGAILQANARFRAFFDSGESSHDFWETVVKATGMPDDEKWPFFLSTPEEQYFSKVFCPLGVSAAAGRICFFLTAHKVMVGSRLEIVALAEDISQVSNLEFEALKQKEFLQGLMAGMKDVVLTVDQTGTILYTSPGLEKFLLGKNLFEVCSSKGSHGDDWGPQIFEADTTVEVSLSQGGKGRIFLELVISELKGEKGCFLVVGRDLTTIRRLEEQLKYRAIYDGLTKIYNRHQFQTVIKRESMRSQRTKRPLGMIFFDVDNFKRYNDTYGHQEGDKVLQNIGQNLRTHLRKGMDFPCRYGGDEFVVLATEVRPRILELIARRVAASFVETYKNEMTLSIGLAIHVPGESIEKFLGRADQAAYASKAGGGNAVSWAVGQPPRKKDRAVK